MRWSRDSPPARHLSCRVLESERYAFPQLTSTQS